MKLSALILGIVGALIGFIVSAYLPAYSYSGASAINESIARPHIGMISFIVVFILMVGILGGALAIRYSKIAGIMMLVSAIGELIISPRSYFLSILLLAVGGILALCISQKKEQSISKE